MLHFKIVNHLCNQRKPMDSNPEKNCRYATLNNSKKFIQPT